MSGSIQLSLRVAALADADAIVGLIESAYRGDHSRRGWTTEADLLDGQRTDAAEVTGLITERDSQIWLAEEQSALLGCVWLSRQDDHAHVGMLAVRPTRQAHGIGRRLLLHAEAIARSELKVASVEMTVIAQRPELLAWYERRGYLHTGEERPFPYGDARFGLPRRGDLRFLVLLKTLFASV